MTTTSQFWISLFVSSGLLSAILHGIFSLIRLVRRAILRFEDHERRIGRIEDHLDPHAMWARSTIK